MKVLSVCSEMFPLIKTGGLADMTGALPAALAGQGVDMRVLLPAYRGVALSLESCTELAALDLPLGRAGLRHCRMQGIDIFLLDAPALYDRPGGPYLDAAGQEHPDNWKRFALLAQAAAAIACGALPGWVPDVVHAHDWQAGLCAACLRAQDSETPVIQTIHNVAFAGRFPAAIFPELGLPEGFFGIDGVEFYGDVSFLKAGLAFSDLVTTVSPTYAEELTRPAMGGGFDGLLRARGADLVGILNGIDSGEWNPETDPLITRQYTASRLGQRQVNRNSLYTAFALEDGRPLVAMVSRLTDQKGVDLVFDAAGDILGRGFNLIILGAGDEAHETRALAVGSAHPGRAGVHVGYDEALAHRIQAGTDALLVPSRFEPCGLTQMCALRYGALPIVAPTGGLVDSVIDASPVALAQNVATGLHLREVSATGILFALDRLTAILANPPCHQQMIRNAMKTDVSLDRTAAEYAALYSRFHQSEPRVRALA